MFDWISWGDIGNNLIAWLISLAIAGVVGAAATYAWPRLRNFDIMGVIRRTTSVRTRRQRRYVELLKRVRSNEYYDERQRAMMVHLLIVFGTGIAALQLYQLGRPWLIMVFPMIVLQYTSLTALAQEHAYNQKALELRMRIERERKSPRRKRDLGSLSP